MLYCELHIFDPMEDKAKRFPSAVTNIIKKSIKLWHKKTLPKHFKMGADREYGYQGRSPSYARYKTKKGLPPLVYSGKARRTLKGPGRFKITGSKGSAKGKFINVNSIRYFWMRPKRQPNKAAETTRLSKNEEQQIKNFLQVKIIPELDKTKGRKKIVR